MPTRSIDLEDQSDPTIIENISHDAKRVCICFAIGALAIGGLDLANVPQLERAAAFAQVQHGSLTARWPSLIHSSIVRGTLAEPAAVIVAIPRGMFAEVPRPTRVAFAAHRTTAAVGIAVKSPEVMADETPAVGVVQLASLAPDALSEAEISEPGIKAAPPGTLKVDPPPAPGAPSPAELLHLEGKERTRAERCLANAVYFEARDQSFRGQVAVAQVVMNRVFSGVYPHDVCGVIYQNADRYRGCQFAFACDGRPDVVDESDAWGRARRIARETLDGELYVAAVGAATHYHAAYVQPRWVHEMRWIAREGIHLFYRPRAWGSGADEPVWSRAELAARRRMTSSSSKR